MPVFFTVLWGRGVVRLRHRDAEDALMRRQAFKEDVLEPWHRGESYCQLGIRAGDLEQS